MNKLEEARMPAALEDLQPLVTELSSDELAFVYGGAKPKDDGKGGKGNGCTWTSGAPGKKKCDEQSK